MSKIKIYKYIISTKSYIYKMQIYQLHKSLETFMLLQELTQSTSKSLSCNNYNKCCQVQVHYCIKSTVKQQILPAISFGSFYLMDIFNVIEIS